MTTFILPFEEHQYGWYEIEADTIEEARKIVEQGELIDYEPNYKNGYTDWNIDDLSPALFQARSEL